MDKGYERCLRELFVLLSEKYKIKADADDGIIQLRILLKDSPRAFEALEDSFIIMTHFMKVQNLEEGKTAFDQNANKVIDAILPSDSADIEPNRKLAQLFLNRWVTRHILEDYVDQLDKVENTLIAPFVRQSNASSFLNDNASTSNIKRLRLRLNSLPPSIVEQLLTVRLKTDRTIADFLEKGGTIKEAAEYGDILKKQERLNKWAHFSSSVASRLLRPTFFASSLKDRIKWPTLSSTDLIASLTPRKPVSTSKGRLDNPVSDLPFGQKASYHLSTLFSLRLAAPFFQPFSNVVEILNFGAQGIFGVDSQIYDQPTIGAAGEPQSDNSNSEKDVYK